MLENQPPQALDNYTQPEKIEHELDGSDDGSDDFPSLFDLAAPLCVEGAVIGLHQKLEQAVTERADVRKRYKELCRAVDSHERETRKQLNALRPRSPLPPPADVEALSSTALAASLPTVSLSKAATDALLSASDLWTLLQERIATNEMTAEADRIREQRGIEHTQLVAEEDAAQERMQELDLAIPELKARIQRTQIEAVLIVQRLSRARDGFPADATIPTEAEVNAVVAMQVHLIQSKPVELAVIDGKKRGELKQMSCPLCRSLMFTVAAHAGSPYHQPLPGHRDQEPNLLCSEPNAACAAADFQYQLPAGLRWCHTHDMREKSHQGKLVLRNASGGMPWGPPPKQVTVTVRPCGVLFADPSKVDAKQRCQTCKLASQVGGRDNEWDGADDDDDEYMSMNYGMSAADRMRQLQALPIFCADCCEGAKSYLYCQGSRCGDGPMCSLGEKNNDGEHPFNLAPCGKCGTLRCDNCYDSEAGEFGRCKRCGPPKRSRYDDGEFW